MNSPSRGSSDWAVTDAMADRLVPKRFDDTGSGGQERSAGENPRRPMPAASANIHRGTQPWTLHRTESATPLSLQPSSPDTNDNSPPSEATAHSLITFRADPRVSATRTRPKPQ